MKTALDPRHQRRIQLMQQIFASSFLKDVNSGSPKVALIASSLSLVDKSIRTSAPEWPIDKIAKIDLAILRLATFELIVEKKEPPKVIIDEAVELAKQFGNEKSAQFVNGVLGTILKGIKVS